MRKIYRRKKPTGPPTKYRSNERIKVPEVKLIDEEGQMLGVVSTEEALKKAQEKGLDLVEISPVAKPPVAKIMDYGSFKYQLEKKIQKQKAKQKKVEIKGIRLSLRISEHDRDVRYNQAKKFLEKGHKLKIELSLKGREFRYINAAKDVISSFVNNLKEEPDYDIVIEQAMTKTGKRITIILFNKKQ